MARTRSSPRDEVLQFALGLPGAWEDHPWGESVAKVAKKVFVFLGVGADPNVFHMCVKLPASGDEARLLPFVKPAGYGLGKSGWVEVRIEGATKVPLALCATWVEESYRAVAPKTLLKELDGAVSSATPRRRKA